MSLSGNALFSSLAVGTLLSSSRVSCLNDNSLNLVPLNLVWVPQVEALEREGVDLVFAYPGGASMEIHQALTRSSSIRNILCRHEQVREPSSSNAHKPWVPSTPAPFARNSCLADQTRVAVGVSAPWG